MIKRTKRGFRVNLGGISKFDFADLATAWFFAAERMNHAPVMKIKPYPIMVV